MKAADKRKIFNNSERLRIAVIGGGAAGFFGAVNLAEKNPGYEVTLYEASQKVLSKVLISGGGRCNVTNNLSDPKELTKKYPRGGKELLGPFNSFNTVHTKEWFENCGVGLKVEEDLRVFPQSNKSEDIADCLEAKATKLNIKISTGVKIREIRKENETFTLIKNHGDASSYSKVLIASGGSTQSFELAQSLGHLISPPVPSLFTFEINDTLLDGLSGLSFRNCGTSLKIGNKLFSTSGPVLITHWGLSGPAVIVLSSIAARELFELGYKANLTVNFLKEHSEQSLFIFLMNQKNILSRKKLIVNNPLQLPNSFWERLLMSLDVSSDLLWADVTKILLSKISRMITTKEFLVSGKGKFKEEFVTCGGVNLKEVDFRTMQSKICPGLYFAGEVLDIDGVTGGFNFQAAWTTSWVASQNM